MNRSITRPLLVASMLSCLPLLPAHAQDTAITIYSSASAGAIDPDTYRPINGQTGYVGIGVPGYAIVRQARTIHLPQEKSTVKFSDVAALIDPTTVQFKSLTDPTGTKVGEQDYQFDLVSQQKLLDKYIDKRISVDQQKGDKFETVEGTLLSTQGGITLKTDDGKIDALNSYSTVHFPELPGGLITKPTLVWDIYTQTPGDQKAEVSYETRGITWWADYNLTYHEGKDAGAGTVDFGSWVSIVNQTGAGYNDAKLKLIAGDVQRVQPQLQALGGRAALKTMDMAAENAVAPQFAEKSFFEYHLYTLSKPTTLPDNSTKQLELIPAVAEVPVEKQFIYNGSDGYFWNGGVYTDQGYGIEEGNKKVDVILKLKNTKENGLGVALPAGRMRVSERDDDGALEFIGENNIDHTPKDEDVTIKLGSAFDIVGSRRQVSFSLDTMRRTATEEIEVKLRNHKKQPVKVKVLESLYRATGWNIDASNIDYTKENAHMISFLVGVEPDKEQIVRYTVRYHW